MSAVATARSPFPCSPPSTAAAPLPPSVNSLAPAGLAPPSLREILDAFGKDGGGDRELLLAILAAKRSEEERLASQMAYQSAVFYIAQQSQLQAAGRPMHAHPSNGPPSPPLSTRSSSSSSASSTQHQHQHLSPLTASTLPAARYEPYPTRSPSSGPSSHAPARSPKLAQAAENIHRRRGASHRAPSPPSPRSNAAPRSTLAPAQAPSHPTETAPSALLGPSPSLTVAAGGLPSTRTTYGRTSLSGSPPAARESFLRGSSDEGEPELDVVGGN